MKAQMVLFVLVLGVAASSCGRKTAATKLNDPNAPGYIPPSKVRTFVVNGQIDLAGLTEAVREYAKWKMRVPKSLDELVASQYLTNIPAPPAGQKYAIDPNTLEVTLISL